MRFRLEETAPDAALARIEASGGDRSFKLIGAQDFRLPGAAFASTPAGLAPETVVHICATNLNVHDPGMRACVTHDAMLVGTRFVVLDRLSLVSSRLAGDTLRRADPAIDPLLHQDARGQIFLTVEDADVDRFHGRYMLAFWDAAVMYHHWAFECLTRVHAVLGSPQGADVRILVPLDAPRFVAESLHLLGIDDARITYFDPTRLSIIEELLLTPTPSFDLETCSASALACLREALARTLPPPPAHVSRRVLFTRRDALSGERLLINEGALVDRLAAEGFQPLEASDFSVAEQLSIAHHADFVVCVHGSAGANMLLCQPHARVLHLFPDCVWYFYAHGLANAVAGSAYAYTYGVSFQRALRYHNNPWVLSPERVLDDVARLSAIHS